MGVDKMGNRQSGRTPIKGAGQHFTKLFFPAVLSHLAFLS